MIHKELSLEQLLSHISPAGSHEDWAKAICHIASQLTQSSLTALYTLPHNAQKLTLQAKIGHTEVPKSLSINSEFFQAADWCNGAVVQNSAAGPFQDLLLNEDMQSGIAILLESVPASVSEDRASHRSSKQELFTALLVANYSAPYHYTGRTIALFEQVRTLISYTPQKTKRAGAKAGTSQSMPEKTTRGASTKDASTEETDAKRATKRSSKKTKGGRGSGEQAGKKAGGKE